MKALFKTLLVSSLVYPALISGAASKSGYTENIVVEEIEMDTIEIDSIDYDAIEIDGDTIDDVVWSEEFVDYYHYYDDDMSLEAYFERNVPYPLGNADADMDAGNYKKVLADSEKVLSDYPNASDGKYYAAYANYFLKNYKKSIDLATDLAAAYPSNSAIRKLLIGVSSKDDQYSLPLADKKIRKKMESDYYSCRDSIEALSLMVSLAQECGYLLNALEYLDKIDNKLASMDEADKEDYGIIEYHENQGNMIRVYLYITMGEDEKALKLLDSMGQDKRDEAWYHNRFGALRAVYGLESSLKFEKEALDEYPDDITFGVSLIADLTLAEKYDQAIAKADDLIQSERSEPEMLSELYLRRGMAKKLSGKDDEAETDFMKVIELSGEHVYGPEIYAKCFLGRKDEVLSNIDQYDCTFQASVYNVLGMTEKALEKLGEAYEKCQWNPTRTKYDIFQRSLVSHPSFAKIAEKFQPKKRRF